MAQPSPRTPAFQVIMFAIEWLSMLAFLVLSVLVGVAVLDHLTMTPWLLLLLLPLVPLGFLVADLLTGFGHYFADNFCSEDTPFIGHALVYRFRQHHEDQNIICTLSFRELNGGLAGLTLPMLIAGLLLTQHGSTWAMLGASLCGTSAFFMAATNQIHRWAHGKAPQWVRWLQHRELILSPRRHSRHHKAPHDIHFCISCGWLNPFLDRTRFWHQLSDLLIFFRVPQADESVMGTVRQRVIRHNGMSPPR
jgi:hypothetical protein